MPKPPPTPFAPIGASKINCAGFSTSSSTKTSPACAKALAPKTWPSSDTSPSISLEMPANQFDNAQGSVARRQSHERLKKPASNSAENSQDGTTHTSKPSLPLKPVNLDSEPCWRMAAARRKHFLGGEDRGNRVKAIRVGRAS